MLLNRSAPNYYCSFHFHGWWASFQIFHSLYFLRVWFFFRFSHRASLAKLWHYVIVKNLPVSTDKTNTTTYNDVWPLLAQVPLKLTAISSTESSVTWLFSDRSKLRRWKPASFYSWSASSSAISAIISNCLLYDVSAIQGWLKVAQNVSSPLKPIPDSKTKWTALLLTS